MDSLRGSPKPWVSEAKNSAGSRVMGWGKVAMPRSTEDVQVEGGVGVFGVGEFDDDRAAGGAAEWVFVDVTKAEAAKNDAAVGGAQFDGSCTATSGRGLRQGQRWKALAATFRRCTSVSARPIWARSADVARYEFIVNVGHREEGGAGGANVGDEVLRGDEPADLEAFADGELGFLAVGVANDVGGDVVAGDAAAVEMGVDEDMGEDEGLGGLAQVDADTGAVWPPWPRRGYLARAGVADEEGHAAVGLLTERGGHVGTEEISRCVAEVGQAQWFVVGHRALPISGQSTARGWMVGGIGVRVNGGGGSGVPRAQ